MGKAFKLLLFLFVISLLIQSLFVFLGKGYERTYTVQNGERSYLVSETYEARQKGKPDTYTLLIDNTFSFKIFDNLYKDSQIIKNIYSFKDENYECIYPVFKSKKIKTDVLCKKDTYVYYQKIAGKDSQLDAFVDSIKEYDKTAFIDQKEETEKETFLTVYKNNVQNKHFTIVQNYRGFYNINNQSKRSIDVVSYYDEDIYEPKIAGLASKYFITAAYTGEDTFREMHVIDVTDNSKKTLTTKAISTGSFIEGTLDNTLYLLDKTNRLQYKIDGKRKDVTQTGSGISLPFYENGTWTTKDMNEAIQNMLFSDKKEYENKDYDTILKSNDGYYYLLKKENDKIKVSRVDNLYPNQIIELFTVEEIQNISFGKGFIYFRENGDIKYYSDKTGLRTLAHQSEMVFNKDLKTFTYIQ